MTKIITVSKINKDEIILPEPDNEKDKETQNNIIAGTSIVRDGDNPLQLAYSPNAVFNIAFRSNADSYDNKQAAKDARKSILSIDDKYKVEGNIVAPAVAKLAFEKIETEEDPERRNEIAFGIDTLLALQNQPFVKDEVQYIAQLRLDRMPNEKRKFKKNEQKKGVVGDHVHHVIPVSEDPSKCDDPNNFELKIEQDHVDHHNQEQQDAKNFLEGNITELD